MPLRAIVDGDEVIAPLLSDEQWEELRHNSRARRVRVTLPCCRMGGFLRTSKLGTRHFVHQSKSDSCNWRPETVEHLWAKSQIVRACHDAGYEAIPEATGSDWRADVLARRDKHIVAFEVQWSAQTLEETLQRQERFIRDGINAYWFFRRPLQGYRPQEDLPVFRLALENDRIAVTVPTRDWDWVHASGVGYGIQEFVQLLLSGRIRFRRLITAREWQELKIVFFEVECWKCGKSQHIYYVDGEHVSRCRQGLRYYSDETLDERDEACEGSETAWEVPGGPEALHAAQKFLNTDEGKHIRLGEVKPRFSKTLQRSYVSFGCYSCDALFGKWFVMDDTMEARYYEDQAPAILNARVHLPVPLSYEYPHWCCPPDGSFCAEEETPE